MNGACLCSEDHSAADRLECLLKQIPLSPEQLQQAVGSQEILMSSELQQLGLGPPHPLCPPKLSAQQTVQQRLIALQVCVQEYISHFRYNYCPGYHVNVAKKRSFAQLMRTAKTVIHAELPIKCIEAVFLGMYCTAGWKGLDRWTLSFKTRFSAHTYRHIVLVVHDQKLSAYGALGMSRQPSLMFKNCTFESLSELVQDFLQSYSRLGHEVTRVSFSLPVSHDVLYNGPVGWNVCVLDQALLQSDCLVPCLESFLKAMPSLQHRFRVTGSVPRFDVQS